MSRTSLRYNQNDRTTGLLAIVAIVTYVTWMSSLVYPVGDNVGYRFMMAPRSGEYTSDYVRSLSDIWLSQINHWHTTNGRFACHFIVQIFCGLLPQWIWAVINGLVNGFFVLVLSRFSLKDGGLFSLKDVERLSGYSWGTRCWCLSFLFFLMMPPVEFSPTIQINYVWGLLLEIIFLRSFIRDNSDSRSNLLKWLGWCVLAFIAGEWNEAYSIPVGFAMMALLLFRKGRFSLWRWIGAIAYGIGGILLCCAPGNFIRLEDINGYETQTFLAVRSFLWALWPLLVGFVAGWLLFGVKTVIRSCRSILDNDLRFVLTFIIIGGYILGFVLHFSSGNRVVAGVILSLLIILSTGMTLVRRRSWIGVITIIAVGLFALGIWTVDIRRADKRYEIYDTMYRASSDGRVYLPADLLVQRWRETRFMSFYFMLGYKPENPTAPNPKFLPEVAKDIRRDSDYNEIIPLGNRSWLLVRSEKHPARFLLKRRLGIPGTPLTVPISDRKLDFESAHADIPVDTLPHVRLGLYVNERPYVDATPYME